MQLNALLSNLRIPFLILLTKIDKLNQSGRKTSIDKALKIFQGLAFGDNLLIYSATKGTGKKELLRKLSAFIS
jgi:GTP-binding protein EngB required for normal cell division